MSQGHIHVTDHETVLVYVTHVLDTFAIPCIFHRQCSGPILLFVITGDRVRATFCTGVEQASGLQQCGPCHELEAQGVLWATAERAEQRLSAVDADMTPDQVLGIFDAARHDLMGAPELRIKCNAVLASNRATHLVATRQRGRGERLQHQVSQLKADAQAMVNNQPRFLQLLHRAHQQGHLQQHEALVQLIEGTAAALVHGRRHRHLNDTQKAFFLSLLHYGGPLVHNQVLMVLCGPDIRTTKRWRAGM